MVNNRPFGVEIECNHDEYRYSDDVDALLYDSGFSNWAEQEVIEDGSGIEIRSPILSGLKGMKELKRMMDFLVKKGFKTNEFDGLHVHHDISDLTTKDVHRVSVSWYNNQDNIHKFVNPRRVNAFYCGRLTIADLKKIERQIELEESGRLSNDPFSYSSNAVHHEKYRGLSLASRNYQETIEIRLHEGTVEFEKARAWVLFGQAFISNISKRKRPLKRLETKELLDRCGVYRVAQKTLMQRVSNA